MKVKAAANKLKELANEINENYVQISYEVTIVRGNPTISCSVYINGQSFHHGETWEEALKSMEYAIFPDRKPWNNEIENFDEDIVRDSLTNEIKD